MTKIALSITLLALSSITLTICMDQNQRTVAFDAVDNGDIPTLQRILDTGFNPNEQDFNGQTILHRAAHAGSGDVLQFLLNYNRTIRHNHTQQMLAFATALHQRCVITNPARILRTTNRKVLECFRSHLQPELDLNIPDIYGYTPLHFAVMQNNEAHVQLLLQAGANPMITIKKAIDATSLCSNPICCAQNYAEQTRPVFIPQGIQNAINLINHPEFLYQLHIHFYRTLLLAGAPGCGKTMLAHYIAEKTGCKVLHKSATEFISIIPGSGSIAIRTMVQEASTSTRHENCSRIFNIGSTLRLSAHAEEKPTIVILDEIDAIAGPRDIHDAYDPCYLEPVAQEHQAQEQERIRTLNQLLCEVVGADYNTVIPKILFIFCSNKRVCQLSRALTREDRTNCIELPGGYGQTSLHLAAQMGNPRVMQFLLNWINNQMLSLASSRHSRLGTNSLANTLVEETLKPIHAHLQRLYLDAQDEQGNTPLHYAAMQGNIAIIRMLLHAGADRTIVNNHGQPPQQLASAKASAELE